MPTSGLDLRVRRVRARVKVLDLAAAMGVSRQTLWTIERSAFVEPDRAAQYLEAIETCRHVKTEGTAA